MKDNNVLLEPFATKPFTLPSVVKIKSRKIVRTRSMAVAMMARHLLEDQIMQDVHPCVTATNTDRMHSHATLFQVSVNANQELEDSSVTGVKQDTGVSIRSLMATLVAFHVPAT